MGNVREDFPFLKNNPGLAYFDNAATSLKPQTVIDEVTNFYENLSSNIHRGDYEKSLITSDKFESSRQKVANFLSVESHEIVFTSGASESINLVALGFAAKTLRKNDVILVNATEHASNLLPWYALAENKGFKIEFIEVDETQDVSIQTLKDAMHSKVKIVALAHASNVLGYVRDLKEMSKIVHEWGAYMVVDGAQTVAHLPIDLKELDVDFFSFSGHKMLSPSGVGILYGKYNLLEATNPITFGGGSNLRFDTSGDIQLRAAPFKFESGTPNIEGVLGLGKAIDYLENIGMNKVQRINDELYDYAYDQLMYLDNVKIYNPNSDLSILSFNVKDIFAQDVARYLDSLDIAVRAGDHCAKVLDPTHENSKTVRASLYIYNTKDEIDRFVNALKEITLEKCVALYI